MVRLAIETPDGKIIDETNAAGFGVTFKTHGNTKASSFNLPLAFQLPASPAGTWTAILEVDRDLFKRALSILRDKDPKAASALAGKGARYCVSMHSFSNLRMQASVTQNAYAPDSTLTLRALLNEYNLPVARRANVRAAIEYPDHTKGDIALAEIQPGVFENAMTANMSGIYRFTITARGVTYKGAAFTREQVLTAAIFRTGDIQPPDIGTDSADGGGRLCGLIKCLLKDDSLRRFFKERGLELDSLSKCLETVCDGGWHGAPTWPTPGRGLPRSPREMFAEAKWSDLPGLMAAFRKDKTGGQ